MPTALHNIAPTSAKQPPHNIANTAHDKNGKPPRTKLRSPRTRAISSSRRKSSKVLQIKQGPSPHRPNLSVKPIKSRKSRLQSGGTLSLYQHRSQRKPAPHPQNTSTPSPQPQHQSAQPAEHQQRPVPIPAQGQSKPAPPATTNNLSRKSMGSTTAPSTKLFTTQQSKGGQSHTDSDLLHDEHSPLHRRLPSRCCKFFIRIVKGTPSTPTGSPGPHQTTPRSHQQPSELPQSSLSNLRPACR